MIYIGDGLTDIPCFSLVKTFGGTTFGVFNPGEEGKAKRALVEFLKPARVISMHAPKYGRMDRLRREGIRSAPVGTITQVATKGRAVETAATTAQSIPSDTKDDWAYAVRPYIQP